MKRNRELKLERCSCGNYPQTILGWSSSIIPQHGFHVICHKCKSMTEVYCSKREAQREWNKGNVLYPTKLSVIKNRVFKLPLKYKKNTT